MQTEILKTDAKGIKKAKEILLSGGVIGMPTETVYGLAGDGTNSTAVKEIFKVDVAKVNTMIYKPTTKTQNTKSGRTKGKTASFKKAIVTLTENSKPIEFFESLN